ncbi:MAG: hypothetical protein ACLFQX_01170 [Candidatus Kapaibacterium sp.]
MGRNDTCSMGFIYSKAAAGLKSAAGVIVAALILAIFATPLYGQAAADQEKTKKPPMRIRSTFVPGYAYHYKFTETAEIVRTYEDGSKVSYERDRTFFMTFEQRPEDRNGFFRYEVSVDSMLYRFREGDAEVVYDSQADEVPASSFNDLIAYWVPQGRIFSMVYSPYREVAEVDGEMITWVIDYVTAGETRLSDTLMRYMWVKGVSRSHLAHFADMEKSAIPVGTVIEDSTWSGKFEAEISGVDFRGKINTKISDYRGGHFMLESEMPALEPVKEQIRIYGVEDFVDVTGGNASGTMKIDINPQSTITEAESDIDAEVNYKYRRTQFTEKIKMKSEWKYLNSYKI